MNNNFVDNNESLQASITDHVIESSDEYKAIVEDSIDSIFNGESLGPIDDIHAYIRNLSDNAIRRYELELLEEFNRKLLEDMQDIPIQFAGVIDSNFWDLV